MDIYTAFFKRSSCCQLLSNSAMFCFTLKRNVILVSKFIPANIYQRTWNRNWQHGTFFLCNWTQSSPSNQCSNTTLPLAKNMGWRRAFTCTHHTPNPKQYCADNIWIITWLCILECVWLLTVVPLPTSNMKASINWCVLLECCQYA